MPVDGIGGRKNGRGESRCLHANSCFSVGMGEVGEKAKALLFHRCQRRFYLQKSASGSPDRSLSQVRGSFACVHKHFRVHMIHRTCPTNVRKKMAFCVVFG